MSDSCGEHWTAQRERDKLERLIRKDERERVLNKVIEVLSLFPEGYSMVEDSHGNRISALEYCKLKIEKIRKGDRE